MNRLIWGIVEATEAAAVASYKWIGSGQKKEADSAATDALREKLNHLSVDAVVVIGEGEMDEAPMLYIGEKLGKGGDLALDIAVDPLEGTNLTVFDQQNAMTVIAVAPRGTLLHAPDIYMEKIAVGPLAAGTISLDVPLRDNIRSAARSLGKDVSEFTVMIQDRKRHQKLIEEVYEAGAKVRLFQENDIIACVATALPEIEVDMVVGTGGAPEAVVAAVALKSLGGELQGRLLPQDEEEYKRCVNMGLPKPEEKLEIYDLVKSDEVMFVATGVTDGYVLKGVKKLRNNYVKTHTLCISENNKSYRFIESIKPLEMSMRQYPSS